MRPLTDKDEDGCEIVMKKHIPHALMLVSMTGST
jgi:hypothetical protein